MTPLLRDIIESLILAIQLAQLILFLACFWTPLREEKRRRETSVPALVRHCGLCGKALPRDAVRTSTGFWRCADHKAA